MLHTCVYVAILMQDLQCFKFPLCSVLDLWSSETLLFRSIGKVVIEVLQHEGPRVGRIFHLVNQWAERGCSVSEAFEYVAFILRAEMMDTFNHNGLLE